jgi:hypothetical protein
MNAAEFEVKVLFVLCSLMAGCALWASRTDTQMAIIFCVISLGLGIGAFTAIFTDIKRRQEMAETHAEEAE